MTAENLAWFFMLTQLAIALAGVRLKRAYPAAFVRMSGGRDPAGYLAAAYFYGFGHRRDAELGRLDRAVFNAVSITGWLSLAALIRIGWMQLHG